MVIIKFLESQENDRYIINPNSVKLGRKFDDNSEQVQVIFPENEVDTKCTMIVKDTFNKGIDLIEFENGEIKGVTNTLSQFDKVLIGFVFTKDNYTKYSSYKTFYFEPSLAPTNFEPREPEFKGSYLEIIEKSFAKVRKNKDNESLIEFLNLKGEVVDTITIVGGSGGGIINETDPTVPSHVKKITEGDIVSWSNKAEQSEIVNLNKNIEDIENNKASIDYVDEEVRQVREVAEGKTKSFTISTLTDLGTLLGIDTSTIADEYTITSTTINYKEQSIELKQGDIFLIVDTGVPDYWVSVDDMKIYKMETMKIDLTEYVKNTDIANGTNAGVVKVNTSAGYGVGILESGVLRTVSANKGQISAKASNYMPIVPATLDYSIKVGMTTNTEEWTDEEKLKASELLGVLGKKTGAFDNGAIRGYVYFIDTNNNQIIKPVQIQANADTIPLRNPNGNFYVGKPTLIYECTNKGYVDEENNKIKATIPTITATQLEDGSYSLSITTPTEE